MDVLQQMVDFTKVVKLGLCLIAKLEFAPKVSMEDGKVKLEVDLGVNKLEAPFDASASIASPEFKPEVRAIVDRVGLRFGVEVELITTIFFLFFTTFFNFLLRLWK